jgi:hypothetical protein
MDPVIESVSDRRGGWRRSVALVSALAAALAAPALASPPSDDPGGTYRMRGTAQIDAAAPLGRDLDSRGDAIVRADGPGALRVRLASMGQACELSASRKADGALAFDAGQRCVFDLQDPDARGHVEGLLRAGQGRLRDRHLALDLVFELTGKVALRTAAGVQMLGVELPSAWTPDIRLDGGAAVKAEGDRDESRAAQR